MDERDRTMSDYDLQWYEHEDLRHAYYRTRMEMIQCQKRERATGKTPLWFLEDPDDWTPVVMDASFWEMVAGGLTGLQRLLRHAGVIRGNE